MYASRLDIPEHTRKGCIALLQERLSDCLDLEAQMKQAHWNVKGPDFIQLHQLFDKVHAIIEDFADTIAERITSLGGVADGRVKTTAGKTHLYEYSLQAHLGDQHLRAVAAATAQFGKYIRADISRADQIGDPDTADLLTQISRETDKQLWMVESHLYAD